jgi:hypothetical protein
MKLTSSLVCLLSLSLSLGSTMACAVASDDNQGASESEVQAADRLVGTWIATASAKPVLLNPELRELTLSATATAPGSFKFSAKVDTGLRPVCLPGGPCPSGLQQLEGTFTASGLRLDLKNASAADSQLGLVLGSYTYKLSAADGALALTLNGKTASFARKPAKAFCADGRIEVEQIFDRSPDGKTTLREVKHCLTTANNKCINPVRPPPDYCKVGSRLVMGPTAYSASADGKECARPEGAHCVTVDAFSCPQLSAPGPDYCKGGKVYTGPVSFIPSADGFECEMPSLPCVRN